MSDKLAVLFLSIVFISSFIVVNDIIYDTSFSVSGGNPLEIATITVEADPDFLAAGHTSNLLIWLFNSSGYGLEGFSDSIVLGDDDPGGNPDGWFSQVFEQGSGLYNATYNAPSTFEPNVIVNVTNTQNGVFATEAIILVDAQAPVEVTGGNLLIDNHLFYIQGLSYAPTYNGSEKYDDGAVSLDMPKIANANVNTLRLYVANKYYWGGEFWDDAQKSADVILDYADIYDIKIIVGFWADEGLDWTDQEVRDNQTGVWKEMVLRYKAAKPVLMWALGNEVLNNMDSTNKTAYAQWMENMTQWTHANDPSHPLTYSDAGLGELSTLKTCVPSLDVFSFNYYDFENLGQFQSALDFIYSNWAIPVFLNEYGSDSRDNDADEVNQTKHAIRLQTLYKAVEDENRNYPPGFLGSLWFEWTDQWNFEGASDVQDPGTWWGWSPISCFDNYADLEYFGIASCADYGDSANRKLREAYWTLKELYMMPVHNIDLDIYYRTIQVAVEDADSGNTILVSSGVYGENVIIDKAINLVGTERDTTIINGKGGNEAIIITADWVNITGFTITNASKGIHLISSSYHSIQNNKIINNQVGIFLESSDNNIITKNDVSYNGHGIRLNSSNENIIYLNNFIDNEIQASDDTDSGNQWDFGYPLGGNYWSDYNGVDLNGTPTQDVPPSDSLGDTPYVIDSDTQDNYPSMDPVGNKIFLPLGWNLISIPWIQSDSNLGAVVSSITGFYDRVQWYDANDNIDSWKHYQVSKSSDLNDLNFIDHTIGFWIHVTEPEGVIFEYPGTHLTQNQTITLHTGWNMVGFPSLRNHNRTEGLNNLTFGQDVDLIQWYDAETQTWYDMGENDDFVPGIGYWIYAKSDCQWEVPL